MFKLYMGRAGTGHRRGYIYENPSMETYCLVRFHTDFFYEVNGVRRMGKAGDCILHRPGTSISHGPLSAHTAFVNDWLRFFFDEEELAFMDSLPYNVAVSLEESERFTACFADIRREQHLHDPLSPRLISNAIFQLLTVLKRSEHSQINQENTLYRTFVTLRSTFHARCGEPWTLERMAKHSGYSTSHFCALYKSFFGISPIDDLLDRRLELAKDLIAQKAHQIQEIAALCGFSSLHYFSEFFKKRTGKSPSEY